MSMRRFACLLRFRFLTAAALFLAGLTDVTAQIEVTENFGQAIAVVSLVDGPNDPNPFFKRDEKNNAGAASYNLAASASGVRNGGSGMSDSTLTGELSVSGNILSYNSSSEAECTFNRTDFDPSFSRVSGETTSVMTFFVSGSSSYSISGTVFVENGLDSGVYLQDDGGRNIEKFEVFNARPGDVGPHTLDFSKSGELTAGRYTVRMVVRPDTPQPLTVSRASGTVRFRADATTESKIRWNNAAGGSFQDASNWEPQKVPTAEDIATFELPGSYTVTLDANVTNKSLRGNGTGVNPTFEMRGHTYTADRLETGGLADESISFTFTGVFAPSIFSPNGLNAEPEPPSKGDVNDLMLSETDKIAFFEGTLLPNIANVEGELTLNFGTVFSASELNIGREADDAKVSIAGGTNAFCDKAMVGVEAGGVFTSGGVGTIAVSDVGTIFLVTETLTLGQRGTGTLTLSEGRVELGQGVLGAEPDSSGSIEITSGRFEAGSLTVGRGGAGTMLIGGGFSGANIRFLEIGHDPDNPDSEGSGIVRVNDSGTLLLKGDVVVGNEGILEA